MLIAIMVVGAAFWALLAARIEERDRAARLRLWYWASRAFLLLGLTGALTCAHREGRVPRYDLDGFEVGRGTSVHFCWQPDRGHYVSIEPGDDAVFTLRFPDSGTPEIDVHDDRFLIIRGLGKGSNYLTGRLLADGDEIAFQGASVVYGQSGRFPWESIEITHSAGTVGFPRANALHRTLGVRTYSERYYTLSELVNETPAVRDALTDRQSAIVRDLTIFKQSGVGSIASSRIWLAGTGLRKCHINGVSVDVRAATKLADGDVIRWRRIGGGQSQRISIFALEDDRFRVRFRDPERTYPLQEIAEATGDDARALLTNTSSGGRTSRIQLPWLFPDQEINGYLSFDQDDTRHDFVYSNGRDEFDVSFNQSLPSPLESVSIRATVSRLTTEQLMTIWLIAIASVVIGGVFWLHRPDFDAIASDIFVFVFLLEVFVAVRLVLGLKGALYPPFNDEALQLSMLSMSVVPFLAYLATRFRSFPEPVGGRALTWSSLLTCPESAFFGSVVGMSILVFGQPPRVWVVLLTAAHVSFLFGSILAYRHRHQALSVPGPAIVRAVVTAALSRFAWIAAALARRHLGRLLVWLVFVAGTFVLSLAGGGEALRIFGVRVQVTVIAYFALLPCYVWSLGRIADTVANARYPLASLVCAGVITAALYVLPVALFTGDYGFAVHLLPLLFLPLLGGTSQRNLFALGVAALALVVIGLYLILKAGAPSWHEPVPQGKLAQLFQTTIERFLSIDELGKDPTRDAFEGYTDHRLMEAYGAQGLTGRGYLTTQLVPSLYGTGLNDKVYATFVLAEHGAVGGLALIGLYVLLYWSGRSIALRTLGQRDLISRYLLAMSILLTVVVVSLYIVGAAVIVSVPSAQSRGRYQEGARGADAVTNRAHGPEERLDANTYVLPPLLQIRLSQWCFGVERRRPIATTPRLRRSRPTANSSNATSSNASKLPANGPRRRWWNGNWPRWSAVTPHSRRSRPSKRPGDGRTTIR